MEAWWRGARASSHGTSSGAGEPIAQHLEEALVAQLGRRWMKAVCWHIGQCDTPLLPARTLPRTILHGASVEPRPHGKVRNAVRIRHFREGFLRQSATRRRQARAGRGTGPRKARLEWTQWGARRQEPMPVPLWDIYGDALARRCAHLCSLPRIALILLEHDAPSLAPVELGSATRAYRATPLTHRHENECWPML